MITDLAGVSEQLVRRLRGWRRRAKDYEIVYKMLKEQLCDKQLGIEYRIDSVIAQFVISI